MVPRVAVVVVLAGLVVASGWVWGQPPPAPPADAVRPKADQTAEILSVLRSRVAYDGPLNETTLAELLATLGKKHKLTFVVRDRAFRDAGVDSVREAKPDMTATRLDGMSLHRFLDLVLDSQGATYLVRRDHVEIVPIAYAIKEAKVTGADDDGATRLPHPLVSAIYREKPLNEAVADLAAEYDLTVIVSPQAGDNKTGFVTARLLNVPADEALELLAVQADLRVVRKGAAFLITGKDHANELFGERLDHERQKIEVDRLRFAPPTPQPPPAPVAPAPAIALPPPAEKK
ncbi:MAG: hypothetical protein JWO38_5958 [Gemmataceae bacterium]|nr:hypothetical protein [Gemmataceae bacterium]